MFQHSLRYQLFSGVCLGLIGVSWVYSGLSDETTWWVVVGAFMLLGASGYFFTAYRQFRRRKAQH
jgi:apolipoprotein N-acyltransferase